MEKFTKNSMKQAISDKLSLNFGCTVEEATDANMMKACAMVLRDQMSIQAVETRRKVRKKQLKQVHYMSLEFLMGRSLMKNAYNLGVLQPMREAVEEMGFKPAHIFDMEPDAGLGNGGLGRLAACYLDSLTTLEIPACGYSICYELGIFKQKIVDGQQMELPDNWKDQGDAWLIPRPDEVEEVHFGGTLREFWDGDRLHVVNEDYTKVLAVPCDMSIAGYDTAHTNILRLWDAKSPTPIDMSAFNQGDYLRASEDRAMAEAIAKVLYPEDNHYEGKSLRLRQQYFFVSATVQSIVRKHIQTYHTLTNFHEKNVIQINDTHPALVIPELMRILMDDAGLDWETSWNITVNSVAYTNHTVLAEALERWPQTLMQSLLPRIWQILCEIARRWQVKVTEFYHGDESKKDIHEANFAYLQSCREAALYGAEKLGWSVLRCCDGENPPRRRLGKRCGRRWSRCCTERIRIRYDAKGHPGGAGPGGGYGAAGGRPAVWGRRCLPGREAAFHALRPQKFHPGGAGGGVQKGPRPKGAGLLHRQHPAEKRGGGGSPRLSP